MNESKTDTKPGWIDPDDAPELDDTWFQGADQNLDGKLVRRGRPLSGRPKKAISLRIDADVLEAYKSKGSGWQSRMNEALRKAAGLGSS
jgi:uncharacterized protein (DUF4415 family)